MCNLTLLTKTGQNFEKHKHTKYGPLRENKKTVITYSFLLYSSVRSTNDNTTGLKKEEKERNNSNLVFPEFSKDQNITSGSVRIVRSCSLDVTTILSLLSL